MSTDYIPYRTPALETELSDHMAQSATPKTPLGTPVFWESGANPPSEWSTWFGTLKMAIMARDNLVVDKLLRLKPTRAELFYPTLPTYEDPFEGETEDEERQREQRNEKRKVDWEYECKQIEYKGPLVRSRPKGQKSCIPLVGHRGLQNLPPTKSSYKDRAMYNQRVGS